MSTTTNTIEIDIAKVVPNEKNPRTITGAKFEQLCKSLEEFPQMLKLRPIVVDENMVVLGGNMRLQSALHIGIKKVWITKVEGLTEKQKSEFIIKDNIDFGQWDWDILANTWDSNDLTDWGMDIWNPKTQLLGFDVIEEENDDTEEEKSEKTNDQNKYISYEIVMHVDTKLMFVELINKIKEKNNLDTTEEAIIQIINSYK